MGTGYGCRGTGEAALPTRGSTCSTAELRTFVRKESNLRQCDPRSNSALHHRRWLIGHDPGTGDSETRQAQARRKALWPLSYRCNVHRAGFEPATSRVIGEVTEIFTTDRDGVGGERSMLLLPLRAIRLSARRVRTCSALSRLHHEVTDIFTTARPLLSHRPLMSTLGNGRCRRQ